MAPKKKEQQKMSLGDFLTDSGFGGGSWADEVEETSVIGTQALPPSDRFRPGGGSSAYSSFTDRGYSVRDSAPARFPDKPPYTAHLGNLSYDATNDAVNEFFEGCDVASVRIIEDKELMRPKGFGYVEFSTPEGLKKALTLDGEQFQSRPVRIKIADPPREGQGMRSDGRDLDWSRKGPLPDAPAPARGGGMRQSSDFGERREPREPREPRPQRDLNWGAPRSGPLAPLPQSEQEPRDGSRSRPSAPGMGERGESHRSNRAAWGEGGPRREFQERPERPERPERAPTAADQDMKWRERMRPDAAAETPATQESSAPASPALSNAAPAPAGRPKLNLQKRTVSNVNDTAAGGESKASIFGGAKPIDTSSREREIEEKRQQALKEKKEADEKAKEERKAAKEAAAAKAAEEEQANKEAAQAEGEKSEETAEAKTAENGSAEQQLPVRTREAPPSRATEASSWRSSGEQRGGRGGAGGPRGGRGGERGRGGRGEGRGGARASAPPSQPASPTVESEPTVDEDGWTTVTATAKKGRGVRS